MFTLKNKYIEAKFDENTRLVSLKRKGGENILVRPANEGFRAVMAFVKKERLENLAELGTNLLNYENETDEPSLEGFLEEEGIWPNRGEREWK